MTSKQTKITEAKAEQKTKKSSTKKATKRDGPRRPLSSYMLFVQKNREMIAAQNPGAKFADIGKMLGTAWAKMDEEEKQIYHAMAECEKERYADELAALVSPLHNPLQVKKAEAEQKVKNSSNLRTVAVYSVSRKKLKHALTCEPGQEDHTTISTILKPISHEEIKFPKVFKVHFMTPIRNSGSDHDLLVFTADTDMYDDIEFLRIAIHEAQYHLAKALICAVGEKVKPSLHLSAEFRAENSIDATGCVVWYAIQEDPDGTTATIVPVEYFGTHLPEFEKVFKKLADENEEKAIENARKYLAIAIASGARVLQACELKAISNAEHVFHTRMWC